MEFINIDLIFARQSGKITLWSAHWVKLLAVFFFCLVWITKTKHEKMDCQDFIFTEKKSFYVLFAAGQMYVWRFTRSFTLESQVLFTLLGWSADPSRKSQHVNKFPELTSQSFATLPSRLMVQNKPRKRANSTTRAAFLGRHDSRQPLRAGLAEEPHSLASWNSNFGGRL